MEIMEVVREIKEAMKLRWRSWIKPMSNGLGGQKKNKPYDIFSVYLLCLSVLLTC